MKNRQIPIRRTAVNSGAFLRYGVAIALIGLATPLAPSAEAREIHLGGTNSQSGAPSKLPPNIVELPSVVMLLRREDGGWRHIQIDAWLAPQDVPTAKDLDGMKTTVVQQIKEGLPGPRGFETLQSAREGSQAAKELIHAAAERSLGRAWSGEVLIRDMLVY